MAAERESESSQPQSTTLAQHYAGDLAIVAFWFGFLTFWMVATSTPLWPNGLLLYLSATVGFSIYGGLVLLYHRAGFREQNPRGCGVLIQKVVLISVALLFGLAIVGGLAEAVR